jgi:hypothetical protein
VTNRILAVTGSAPYLGGESTWRPLREAAPEFQFIDLDLLRVEAGGDFSASAKAAIAAAANGARAAIAHGAAAALLLEALAQPFPAMPVMLLSPLAVTVDSVKLRVLRALLRGPAGALLNAAARSKREKLLTDTAYLRRQMTLLVRDDAISGELLQEARERVADKRMEPVLDRTAQTLCELLTPSSAFERFNGVALFGQGPVDVKARRRIPGTVLDSAWSAPMIEAPAEVAEHLRRLAGSR